MRSARKLTKASRAGTVSGNGQSPGCLRHFFPPGSSCAYLTTAAPPMFRDWPTEPPAKFYWLWASDIQSCCFCWTRACRAGRNHLIAGSRQNEAASGVTCEQAS
jgi:hypothetical protein